MVTATAFTIAILAAAATPEEQNASLRFLVTEGWETGAYEVARSHAAALADVKTASHVQLALVLTELRHNLPAQAKAELVADTKSENAWKLGALAWIVAGEGKHASALENFELAMAAAAKEKDGPNEMLWQAIGRYFGYLESGAAGYEIRAPYFAARDRMLAAASESQQQTIAREQAAVALRLGKSPAFANATGPIVTDAGQLEALRNRTIGDIDRRLQTLDAESQRQALVARQLKNDLFRIAVAREAYREKPTDPFGVQLERGSAVRFEACRLAAEQSADLAAKAGMWSQRRRFLARKYDALIQAAKGAAPHGSTLVPLLEVFEFPYDAPRQFVLRAIASDAERKALTPGSRVWTDRRGKRGFVAELASFDGERVVLRASSGKEVSVALESLSHADQDFLDDDAAPTEADASLAVNQVPQGLWVDPMMWMWRKDNYESPEGWSHRGGMLSAPRRGGGKQLMLPLHLQDASYDLVLEASQWSEGFIVVVVPVGTRNVNVILGPLGRKLQWTAGREDWEAMILYALRDRIKIAVAVTLDKDDAEIKVSVNDKPIQTWRGKQADLDGWGISDRAGFALGAWDANVSYHSVKFRLRSGQAERVGASASQDKHSPVDPVVSDGIFKLIKIDRANYGAGQEQADVTEIVRTALGDPFIGVQVDPRTMGDPAFGQAKQLTVNYEIDGKEEQLTLGEGQVSTLPPLPPEGIEMPLAKELRIVGARYGGGTTWIDVTRTVAERVLHPGEAICWGGLSPQDPWPGVRKHVAVWFDYDGRRYARIFVDGETHPLLPSAVGDAPRGLFDATALRDAWTHEKTAPVKLASNAAAFGLLSEVAGDFAGEGEEIRLQLGKDNIWRIGGTAARALAGHAICLSSALRDQFEAKPVEFTWTNKNNSPKKMIHASEGFCVLASVSGNFAGAGEEVNVFIDPHTQDWYLHGRSQQPLSARAYAYRLKKNHTVKLRFAEYYWHPGYQKIDLIPANQGFCYLSSVGGDFAGFGEQVRVVQGDDRRWQLAGVAAKPLSARAIAVRVEESKAD